MRRGWIAHLAFAASEERGWLEMGASAPGITIRPRVRFAANRSAAVNPSSVSEGYAPRICSRLSPRASSSRMKSTLILVLRIHPSSPRSLGREMIEGLGIGGHD